MFKPALPVSYHAVRDHDCLEVVLVVVRDAESVESVTVEIVRDLMKWARVLAQACSSSFIDYYLLTTTAASNSH